MSLRGKLLLAQVPIVLALVAIAAAGGALISTLGRSSQAILKDNYRSVLAAERMKDALERVDRAALEAAAGAPLPPDLRAQQQRFEQELRAQEGNITEPGEGEATRRLRAAWDQYRLALEQQLAGGGDPKARYLELRSRFEAVRGAADAVLDINQDAMVRRSDEAQRIARRSIAALALISIAGFLLGVLASGALTARLLRPLAVVGQAARRIGEGDLAARAVVEGGDEIARLAAEFNTMAERLLKYRRSSLGDLLEAQRASQAVIDSIADPVIVLAAGGSLQHANRSAEALLGITVESGLGPADPAVQAAIQKVHHHVTSGLGAFAPRGLGEAIRIATGEGERFLLPRATPVYSEEGNVTGTAVILQDVTRMLRFEQLRNDVVATVAHEFRTPLTSLRMAIHLLTERTVGELSEKQADLLYAAREDCERLQAIVDDLLDLSRIQAGRIELRKAPAEVEKLVRGAVEGQRAQAAQKGLTLRSEVLPGMGQVELDADRIELVFANLLSNAIRHSPQGGEISVRAAAEDGAVRFEVSDQGPGIPKQYQQAIFDKYFQIPGAPSGGAGLGLFICREIVQAHGGEIGVRSEPGKGSTFWFRLPAAPDEPQRPSSS